MILVIAKWSSIISHTLTLIRPNIIKNLNSKTIVNITKIISDMKYFARILHDKLIEKKNIIVDVETNRIKPRPKKYKIKLLWRRFINDKTLSAFTISFKY